MTGTRFESPDASVRDTLGDWLEKYIKQPHPELGRDGPVCPFVDPAERAGTLELVVHAWQAPHELPTMVQVIEDALRLFETTTWRSANKTLHALVVAITGLPQDAWSLVDEGQLVCKDDAVRRGLMIGQFHPHCLAPAARNTWFPVNRAPLPVFAIRNMAFHDVLFLHDNEMWFGEYQRRFGHYYTGSRRIEPQFAELFHAADARRPAAAYPGRD